MFCLISNNLFKLILSHMNFKWMRYVLKLIKQVKRKKIIMNLHESIGTWWTTIYDTRIFFFSMTKTKIFDTKLQKRHPLNNICVYIVVFEHLQQTNSSSTCNLRLDRGRYSHNKTFKQLITNLRIVFEMAVQIGD